MIETTRFTLDNGLRVVHHYDSTTPMLAIDLLYNVGARDEEPHLTGMAHLFEHLMFGGSANVPDYTAALQRAGGWDNAWTSCDFTNFYNVVPAVNAETAFRLESDRMLALTLSQQALDVQRSVVIEEFKQTCLNQPYGRLQHELRTLLYRTHPYSHPVIGREIAHIEAVTTDDLRRFFFHHYAPNNAVLAISGNLTAERARHLTQKWFGPIPARQIAPRTYRPEAPVTEPRRRVVTDSVPRTVVIQAFPMAAYGAPGYTEADIITDILSNGNSSLFQRSLVARHPDLFVAADASIIGSDEPGFLMLQAFLATDTDEAIAHAEELMLGEARTLAEAGAVSRDELERVANRYESQQVYETLGYLAKAQRLAMAEMHHEDLNASVQRYRAVTPRQITDTASSLLSPDRCCTLIYRPA